MEIKLFQFSNGSILVGTSTIKIDQLQRRIIFVLVRISNFYSSTIFYQPQYSAVSSPIQLKYGLHRMLQLSCAIKRHDLNLINAYVCIPSSMIWENFHLALPGKRNHKEKVIKGLIRQLPSMMNE